MNLKMFFFFFDVGKYMEYVCVKEKMFMYII